MFGYVIVIIIIIISVKFLINCSYLISFVLFFYYEFILFFVYILNYFLLINLYQEIHHYNCSKDCFYHLYKIFSLIIFFEEFCSKFDHLFNFFYQNYFLHIINFYVYICTHFKYFNKL
jgi:hypothetical protein